MSLISSGPPIKRLVLALLILSSSSIGTLVRGQQIAVKLIDGRNGHPIANTCLNVWVGHQQKDALAIPTDKNGVAILRLTNNGAEVNTQDRWKDCGEFGVINPVVKFESTVRINVGYVLCQLPLSDYSWLKVKDISTEQLLRRGFVTSNTCGKTTVSPAPGEVAIFVRPLNFWEKLKR